MVEPIVTVWGVPRATQLMPSEEISPTTMSPVRVIRTQYGTCTESPEPDAPVPARAVLRKMNSDPFPWVTLVAAWIALISVRFWRSITPALETEMQGCW